MNIFPAIDLIGGKAVRLLRGDYAKMTVYSEHPEEIALDFQKKGAKYLHLVDLEGARDGGTPNLEPIRTIIAESGLSAEIGGGVRDLPTIEKYLNLGAARVILGTAAVRDPDFAAQAVREFSAERIAVGADLKDGKIAVKGWLETADEAPERFLSRMAEIGMRYLIATDISRDGAMRGTNLALYRELQKKYAFCVTASGGVSSLKDVRALREMDTYAAIIGKAYYTGDIDLSRAIEAAL